MSLLVQWLKRPERPKTPKILKIQTQLFPSFAPPPSKISHFAPPHLDFFGLLPFLNVNQPRRILVFPILSPDTSHSLPPLIADNFQKMHFFMQFFFTARPAMSHICPYPHPPYWRFSWKIVVRVIPIFFNHLLPHKNKFVGIFGVFCLLGLWCLLRLWVKFSPILKPF